MADPTQPAAPAGASVGAKPHPGQALNPNVPPPPVPAWLAELPARPIVKKPRLPDGARIVNRRLNVMRHRPPPNLTRANQHLAPKRRIDIRPGTSLVAVFKRVQKLLDKSPRGVLVQKLQAPLLPDSSSNKKKLAGSSTTGKRLPPLFRGGGSGVAAAQDDDGAEITAYGERFDALVIGTGGRNIEKALKVAAVFQRRGDCVVRIYTNTVTGIDTYEVGGGEDNEDDVNMEDGEQDGDGAGDEKPGRVLKQRVRKASSLEVGIRLK